jgi:hypothetical protein
MEGRGGGEAQVLAGRPPKKKKNSYELKAYLCTRGVARCRETPLDLRQNQS